MATGLPPAVLAAARRLVAERPAALADTATLRERVMWQLAGGTRAYRVRRPDAPPRFWYARVPRSVGMRLSLTVSAVVLLLVGVVFALRGGPRMAMRPPTTYVTAAGERARIELSDGTHVWLDVAGRLEIPEGFGGRDRVVHLSGEAYFDVARTTSAPFIVDAAGTQARVLGTEFGVRAYQPADVRVAVRSGRVAVGHTVLGARDVAHIDAGGRVLVAHGQDLSTALAFVTGRLVLPDMALRDAIPELNRWYDADIRLRDTTLGGLRLHATLMAGSIGDLMEMLRQTFGVRVARDGRTITLFPR